MPLYEYISPDGERIELLQSAHDKHEYIVNGVAWQRVWFAPQIGISTKIDAFSEKDFINKTNKVGTVGDLWDLSAEMKQKRIDKDGRDFIGEKHEAEQKAKSAARKNSRRGKEKK